jgi:hypothetical protein
MNNDILDELFALRLYYVEYIQNESEIIYKLKEHLFALGITNDNLNNYLYIFYNTFDIPITLSEIEAVNYNNNINNNIDIGENLIITFYNNLSDITNNLTNIIDNTNEILDNNLDGHQDGSQLNENQLDDNQLDDSFDQMPPLIDTSIFTLLNNIIQPINNPLLVNRFIDIQPPLLQDVVVTTDQNSLDNIETLTINKEMTEKCSICLVEMEENDEYLNIECKHIYHKDCLTTYLQNYNHKCPVCRHEIGQSHINY